MSINHPFLQQFRRQDIPEMRPGDLVRVSQRIKEGNKERIQTFEGILIARKHGSELGATITLRKVISGVGVEKTYPIHSPTIEKIEVIRPGKARRAKLYYLRSAKGRKSKIKARKE